MTIYDAKVGFIPQVSFSWKLDGPADQKSYQITVTDDSRNLVWDSGIVACGRRHNIPCDTALDGHASYTWTLTVTDTEGTFAVFAGDSFSIGQTEWTAKWIEPDRQRKPLTDSAHPITGLTDQRDPFEILDPAVDMRKTFTLDAIPEKAIMFSSARGIYNLKINNTLISDLFAPGCTSYTKHIEYQNADVTALLRTGENVISATLADGWYTGKIGAVGIGQQYGTENALIFQMDILKDGSWTPAVVSDSSVKFAESPWQYADLFIGSGYVESMERTGWEDADYDDSRWQAVKECDFGYAELSPQTIPPIREYRTITPKVYKAPNGDLLLDAGEIIVGYVHVNLDLKAGDTLTLEHTEVLDKEGNYMVNIVGQNKNQTDTLLCARDGIHDWTPQFTNHGFQYVRVTGTQDMDPAHYEIIVIHTPMTHTGSFSCSDQRLNTLHDNIIRSQEGNMIAIPTDCPQREKTGWAGDMQVYAPTACYEMDVEQFVRHWLEDMRNEQLSDGQIPHIIPYIPSHDIMKPAWIDGVSAAGWSDACVIVPWRLYECYGDKAILEENFDMMTKYMNSLKQRVAAQPANCESSGEHMQYIWNNDFQYGDWLMPSAVKSGLVGPAMMMLTGFEAGTLMYAYTNDLMRQICTALGKTEEAADYEAIYHKVCEAFMIEFANADGTLKKDYQGLYILALAMNAVPEDKRANTISKLVSLIHDNDDRLDTGFLSIPFLLPILHECGHADLANTLLFQEKEPSWLYEVKCGATTLWESWDALEPDGTPKVYSMNHFAFGCVGEYLYKYIAGIRPAAIGFDKVLIKPDFDCGLTHVDAKYDSILGPVEVHWTKDNNSKTLRVTLPPNMSGTAVIGDTVTELTCGTVVIEG